VKLHLFITEKMRKERTCCTPAAPNTKDQNNKRHGRVESMLAVHQGTITSSRENSLFRKKGSPRSVVDPAGTPSGTPSFPVPAPTDHPSKTERPTFVGAPSSANSPRTLTRAHKTRPPVAISKITLTGVVFGPTPNTTIQATPTGQERRTGFARGKSFGGLACWAWVVPWFLLVLGGMEGVKGVAIPACPPVYTEEASEVAATGGWNVWSASCAMGSTYTVVSGKTVKIKKHATMSGELVIDRGGRTSASPGRHFVVNGGILELEGMTLKGGYASSLLNRGGAVLIWNSGTGRFGSVEFTNNIGRDGGAVYIIGSSSGIFTTNNFENNTASGASGNGQGFGKGGAVYVGGSGSSGKFINSVWNGNIAAVDGGKDLFIHSSATSYSIIDSASTMNISGASDKIVDCGSTANLCTDAARSFCRSATLPIVGVTCIDPANAACPTIYKSSASELVATGGWNVWSQSCVMGHHQFNVDACPSCKNLTSIGVDACTTTSRCDQCEGDCDTDADCKAGLTCFQRTNGEVVPDCSVGAETNDAWDFCTTKSKLATLQTHVLIKKDPAMVGPLVIDRQATSANPGLHFIVGVYVKPLDRLTLMDVTLKGGYDSVGGSVKVTTAVKASNDWSGASFSVCDSRIVTAGARYSSITRATFTRVAFVGNTGGYGAVITTHCTWTIFEDCSWSDNVRTISIAPSSSLSTFYQYYPTFGNNLNINFAKLAYGNNNAYKMYYRTDVITNSPNSASGPGQRDCGLDGQGITWINPLVQVDGSHPKYQIPCVPTHVNGPDVVGGSHTITSCGDIPVSSPYNDPDGEGFDKKHDKAPCSTSAFSCTDAVSPRVGVICITKTCGQKTDGTSGGPVTCGTHFFAKASTTTCLTCDDDGTECCTPKTCENGGGRIGGGPVSCGSSFYPKPRTTSCSTCADDGDECCGLKTCGDRFGNGGQYYGIPIASNGVSACTTTSRCDQCEGDCDTDDECKSGLLCKQRRYGNEILPGCVGSAASNGYDYCYEPTRSSVVTCHRSADTIAKASNTTCSTCADDGAECCVARQSCLADTSGGSCAVGFVKVDTVTPGSGLCAESSCGADDFGDDTTPCCAARQSCSKSSGIDSSTCATGTIKDDSGLCAGTTCDRAEDFGDATKACCKIKTCGNGDAVTCGPAVGSEESYINVQNFQTRACSTCADNGAECCVARQPCTADTSGGSCSVDNKVDISGFCAGSSCVAGDFGDDTTECCELICSTVPGGTCDSCINANANGCTSVTCSSNKLDTNNDPTDGCEAGCLMVVHGTCDSCINPNANGCTSVTCLSTHIDINGQPSDGCEQACSGLNGIQNGYCKTCANFTVSGCTSVECSDRYVDTNNDPTDGCEVHCSSIPLPGGTCDSCINFTASGCTAVNCAANMVRCLLCCCVVLNCLDVSVNESFIFPFLTLLVLKISQYSSISTMMPLMDAKRVVLLWQMALATVVSSTALLLLNAVLEESPACLATRTRTLMFLMDANTMLRRLQLSRLLQRKKQRRRRRRTKSASSNSSSSRT
jgi:hypothetical protein